MSFKLLRCASVFALILSSLSIQAASPFNFPIISSLLNPAAHNTKNLIMVLDVKMQEFYLGACGYMMATALQDKISPMIASAHALSFVTSYFSPSEWHIYKNSNLVLFIPKQYLHEHGLQSPHQAGFDLEGWQELEPENYTLSGADFYSSLNEPQVDAVSFEDLSRDSTDLICQMLKNDQSNKWKIYAVGHGAPDAHQVCGLNLKDFKRLLSALENNITTDFFVYQTCFGGSKNQLRSVYTLGGEKFQTFSFPIISGCLTNSISFGEHPSSGVSFKSLFTRVNNSTVIENKMRRLLKSVNELNKCLDFASQLHWANNLLLLRMPGKEYFEPVVDNKSVFKASAMPPMSEKLKTVCADKDRFKVVLFDKPVILESVDVSYFDNFMITSGLSRSKHFVKELTLPSHSQASDEILTLRNVAELFSSLAQPEKQKDFFIETIRVGTSTYNKIIITQEGDSMGWFKTTRISAFTNDNFYSGYIRVDMYKPVIRETNIRLLTVEEGKKYISEYEQAVQKQTTKKHILPFGILDEIFSVI